MLAVRPGDAGAGAVSWKFFEFTRDNPRDSTPRRANYDNNGQVRTGWVVNTMNPTPELTRYLFVEGLQPDRPMFVATPDQIEFLPA